MSRVVVVARRRFVGLCIATGVILGNPALAFAQAWPLPAHVGLVSVVYQNVANTGHRDADGKIVRGYDSATQSALVSLDYAFTDRFSVTVGIPYLGSKYQGPEPSFFLLPIDECHCWNHGFQDFGGAARYTLVNDRVAITPSVSFGVPSHAYDTVGEAALGMALNELRLGVDVGHRLEAWPRLAVSGRYVYAIVDKVEGLSINRSNISIEPAYSLARKLTASGLFAWQITHGGLRSTEFETEEQGMQFDRLIRDNSFHIGASVSRTFRHVDLFVSYLSYVGGTDTHAGHAVTIGLGLPFER